MRKLTSHAFENLLRTPWEFLVAAVALGFGGLCVTDFSLMVLTPKAASMVSVPLFLLALLRTYQGAKIVLYQKRLLQLKPFKMSPTQIPLSKENLYIGQGFQWLPMHRQRLHLLTQTHNQRYLQKNRWYQWVQQKAKDHPKSLYTRLQKAAWLPFKPNADIGGKPWLHGVGSANEQAIYLKQNNRNSHTVVFGRTRVGKTRLLSILVNQDIRNGEAVLVIDPKGDLEVLQDMYAACQVSNRLQDFQILHAGFPEISAKYNPLSQYSNISEIATRITSAIQAEGEGKQFQDFAWKFLNINATCLVEMQEVISYKSLAFFVMRPKQLLLAYCDKILPKQDPHYRLGVQTILKKQTSTEAKDTRGKSFTRADAAAQYVEKYIESVISAGNFNSLHDSIIADLHYAAQLGEEYYGKITASLGPVFDKINKTAAGEIFSWDDSFGLPIINLEEVIKRKKVVYVGLDAMSNKAMSEAIGQAMISDLNSLSGRLYKDTPNQNTSLCLYADEFSEIVREEFVTLLNKAGGAGIRICAFSQTVNDIGVAFKGNQDKPKMLLGNFGTLIMLCIANQDTAKTFTECLETVRTRSHTPSTMSNDRASSENGELFTTYNTDTITEDKSEIVIENDLFSQPKGQAFVVANQSEIYHIRIPLPHNDQQCPPTFETLISEVNL